MTLKNIELAMAEDLPQELRTEKGLPETGMIIIETTNPDLKTNFKEMPQGGIREYLRSLGEFKKVALD